MKKSLVALAVLGASAGFAQAQSSVVIYGTVDAGMIKRTDQSLNIGKRANNTLGFKGVEDLGSGLKALFQLEIRYEPDSGTIEQGANGVQRPLFQGQSRVGLQGAFGMVRLGRGLTAFQETSTLFEPFHGVPSPAGFQTDLMVAGYTSDPLGSIGNSTNRFNNALFYNSNVYNGFQINATVGTKEAASGSAALVGRGTAANPQYRPGSEASANPYSVSATYTGAAGAIMLAAERNAVESRLVSVAGYVMATPELKLMATRVQQDRGHTFFNSEEARSWVVGANYKMGAGKILAGYGQKNQGALNQGMQKTKQMSIGYEYSLSPRTYVYADASNKKGPTIPSSMNIYALGVNHAF